MGLFDRKKPEGKTLEWFASDIGIQVLKKYTTLNSYLLEESYEREYKRYNQIKKLPYNFITFLRLGHKGAVVPSLYFQALADSIHVQPLTLIGPNEALVGMLKEMAQPSELDKDDTLSRDMCLPLEQIVSVDKNPLLYFVKNFNVFNIQDDYMGSATDKLKMYLEIMSMLAIHSTSVSIAQSQWLFDKSTYLSDAGILKTEREFLGTCKELSGFTRYFELSLANLDE